VSARDKITMEDGRELPLFKLDTSSESHPFYTGTQKSVNDMGGRVDKFFKKFGKPGRQVSRRVNRREKAAEAAFFVCPRPPVTHSRA
jgi:ribosomal protein L31